MLNWWRKKSKICTGILVKDHNTQIVSIGYQNNEPFLFSASNLPFSSKENVPRIRQYLGINGKQIHSAGIAIPQHQTDIRYFTLPLLPADDLKNMVQYEMVKKLDYGIEDACIDYTISDTIYSHDNKLFRLIAFSCPRSVIQPIVNEFTAAGVPIHVVDVVPMALMNFYATIEPSLENRTIIGIDIGDSNANLVVAKRGKLLFTRHFPIDFESSSITSHFIQDLSTEIYRTLEYCEIHFEPLQCEQVFLSGAIEATFDPSPKLENEIGIPCKTLSIHMIPASQKVVEHLEEKKGTNLVVAAGLALRIGNEKQ